jgi:16S rRNA (guanine1207-N2)-methyltransferase
MTTHLRAPKNFVNHYFATNTQTADPLSPSPPQTISVAGVTLKFSGAAGVFSRHRLDDGSRILLKALFSTQPPEIMSTACDLGCGWGAIGCFLSKRHPQSRIVLCDINLQAARAAAFNLRQNQLANAVVFCGDSLLAGRAEYFDLIACNPPIRAGNAVIASMFANAQRCLQTGGALWVVIRTAQGAKSWQKRLQQQFGNCETVSLESGYRVLRCVK